MGVPAAFTRVREMKFGYMKAFVEASIKFERPNSIFSQLYLAQPVPSGQKGSKRLSPATERSNGKPFLTTALHAFLQKIF